MGLSGLEKRVNFTLHWRQQTYVDVHCRPGKVPCPAESFARKSGRERGNGGGVGTIGCGTVQAAKYEICVAVCLTRCLFPFSPPSLNLPLHLQYCTYLFNSMFKYTNIYTIYTRILINCYQPYYTHTHIHTHLKSHNSVISGKACNKNQFF